MKKNEKLSIADLKANVKTTNVINNIEAIKGGATEEYCHDGFGKQEVEDALARQDGTYVAP